MRSFIISLLTLLPLASSAAPAIQFGDSISTNHLRGGITAAATFFKGAPRNRFEPGKHAHRSRLSRIHQLIFEDERTRYFTELSYLLSSDNQLSRSEKFDHLWIARDTNDPPSDKFSHHHSDLLPFILTESSDLLFSKFISLLANSTNKIDSPYFWEDLLTNYQYAKPERVHQIIDLLLEGDRIPRMKALQRNSHSWWTNLSTIASAAFYARHQELTKLLLPEYQKISTPKNGTYYTNPLANQLTNSLRRGESEHLKLTSSLTRRQDKSVTLSWSLFGLHEVNDEPINGLHEVTSTAFDSRYDLQVSIATPEGIKSTFTLPKITSPGTTTLPPGKIPPGSQVTLDLHEASQNVSLQSHTHTFSPLPLRSHPIDNSAFKKVPRSGPFAHQLTWEASHLSPEATNIGSETTLLSWPHRADHDFLFTFWLNQGTSSNFWKFQFLGKNGENLGETTLKNGETPIQRVIGWGKKFPLWQQVTHQIPARSFPTGTQKIVLQLKAAGGFFKFTSPKTHWLPSPNRRHKIIDHRR